MSKGILVTGGAGYIGSHVVLALIEKGERVVIIDDFSAGSSATEMKDARLVQGSIADTELVGQIIRENDIGTIFHLAAFIRVDESMREPKKYFANNTEGTRALCKVASENGVGNFIFSSSAAVYGSPERVPITEDTPTVPINPYGESKLRAEKIVIESGMRGAILRYFNVAGVDSEMRTGYRIEANPTHMIRSCIRALVEGRTISINGNDYPTADGTCVRDYIHVSDLAQAHMRAFEYLVNEGSTRVFNCGDGHGYSNLEVVNTVSKVAGSELKHDFGPRREGDPATLVADSSRIQSELGWKPERNLESMIRDELAWVQAKI